MIIKVYPSVKTIQKVEHINVIRNSEGNPYLPLSGILKNETVVY